MVFQSPQLEAKHKEEINKQLKIIVGHAPALKIYIKRFNAIETFFYISKYRFRKLAVANLQ